MKSIKSIIVAFIASCGGLAVAHAADWNTQVQEDVFSGKNTAIMIGGIFAPLNVYLSCDGDRNNKLAVIFKMDDKMPEGVPGEVVIKTDDGEITRYQTKSYEHNDSYGGFATELTAEDAGKLISAIRVAKKRVLVGLQVAAIDMKGSHTFSASGSKKAAELFAKTCELAP